MNNEDDKLLDLYRMYFLSRKEHELKRVGNLIYMKYNDQINEYAAKRANRSALRPHLAYGTLEKKDIIAEVWSEIFRQLQSYAQKDVRVTNLFGLARNIALCTISDIANGIKKSPITPTNNEDKDIDKYLLTTGFIDWPETPIQKLLKIEQYELIRQLVKELPPKQREVIEQIYFEGKSVKAIAVEMKMTTAAVYNRKKKGKDEIERKLLEKGGDTHV